MRKRKKISKNSTVSNMDRLKTITRRVINKLDRALSHSNNEKAREQYEWLFGARSSPVSTLAAVVDLVLKLERSGETTIKVEESAISPTTAISEADAQLIGHFIDRIKGRQHPISGNISSADTLQAH